MTTRTAPLLALLAAFYGAGGLGAQEHHGATATAAARRLLDDALRLAENGDTARAIEQAQRATQVAPDFADAHFLYGLLLSRTAGVSLSPVSRRTDAGHELYLATSLDRENPRYLLELARLRLKHPLLRIQAERMFKRALAAAHKRKDPAVEAEVEAEIGSIYFRRYEAIAHRRVVLGALQSFDWDAAMRDPHYTKDVLLDYSVPVPGMGETDLAKAEEHFRAGVRADSASERASAGLLGLLAEAGRDEEYLDAAGTFARAADSNAHAQLYLGMGLWRAHRGSEADSAFRRALALLPAVERRPLEDLASVLRAGDAVRYRELGDSGRAEFERLYWWIADPLRLTGENEYLLEHLSRVALADLRFSAPDLRLRGWQTDRGQIYIRYGPPPIVATFPPDVQDVHDDLQVGMVTTVWFYPQRNLRFVFFGPPAYNYQRFAGDFGSYAENARVTSPATYDNVPLARALDSIPVQPAQFRSSADTATTEVLFFAGIPIRDMVRGVDLQRGELETGLFISDARMREYVARRGDESVRFGADDQFEIRTQTAALPPGDYLYRFEARLPEAERAARGAARLTVENLHRSGLALSDVIVASRVAPREEGALQRGRRDFFIDPNAAMVFRRREPIHLYVEVYGLAPQPLATEQGRVARFQVSVRLRVDSLERGNVVAKVVGGVLDAVGASARGDDQVTLSYVAQESLEGRDRVPVYLALDMAGAPAGTYQLDLAVKDLTTDRIAVRHRVLHLTEQAR